MAATATKHFLGSTRATGFAAVLCLVALPLAAAGQTWGITDKHSSIPHAFPGQGWALLWDENYQKKPADDALRSALN